MCAALLAGCAGKQPEPKTEALPAPEADEATLFAVDKNINMTTIDNYLGRDDVV